MMIPLSSGPPSGLYYYLPSPTSCDVLNLHHPHILQHLQSRTQALTSAICRVML
jgi:hypothetical protein